MWAMNHETRREREVTSEGYIVGVILAWKRFGEQGLGLDEETALHDC